MKNTALIILCCLMSGACQAAGASSDEAIQPKEISLSRENLQENVAAAAELTPTTTAATPTSARRRIPPTQWREWPVVPAATDKAREIYARGRELGVNPNAFSKVGDCQNLQYVFLWKFDHLNIYEFEYPITSYLDTIENFQGYFDRDGYSTKFGFTAASPLTQLEADPTYCLPEETPLECELRITRPSFVLISLEFPFLNRSPETYERYLRQIIEYTMAQGAVPILATKADNVEGDHSINLTIAKLAFEYDLPLWNWWAAAQPLGDHGIDPYRDGFHISEQAWEERSKTFLMTLDSLWKELRD